MKVVRGLFLIAAVLLAARPAAASPITVLVGDKDFFGTGLAPGSNVQWQDFDNELHDNRSTGVGGEATATNGAQLTDIYSALWFENTVPCIPNTVLWGPRCTPNKDHGTVILPFSGVLQPGATLSGLLGGFQCDQWGAMKVDVNGVSIDFCFNDGARGTRLWSAELDPAAIAAANLIGEVRLNFDHSLDLVLESCNPFDPNDERLCKGLDFIAFDYFELTGDVEPVPEPATFVLVGLGLAAVAARRRLRV